jgi:hypothetical protein
MSNPAFAAERASGGRGFFNKSQPVGLANLGATAEAADPEELINPQN